MTSGLIGLCGYKISRSTDQDFNRSGRRRYPIRCKTAARPMCKASVRKKLSRRVQF